MTQMTVSQITAHVVPRIQKRFSDYASKIGIDEVVLSEVTDPERAGAPSVAGGDPGRGSAWIHEPQCRASPVRNIFGDGPHAEPR